jgi:hypothetical protein
MKINTTDSGRKQHNMFMLYLSAETWTLLKADERAIGLFKRKFLMSFLGAVQEKGQWRRRYNFELYKLYI